MTDDLTRLLHDTVGDVEPTDRLGALRQRTRQRSSRRWLTAGAAVLATAAVVAGIAIAVRPGPDPGPGPSHDPTVSDPTVSDPPSPSTHAVAVYYRGQTPQGPRLYREFRAVTGAGGLDEAVAQLSSVPDDPDYTTSWTPGQLLGAEVQDETIRVEVDPEQTRPGDGVRFADLDLQQVVYTLQAAAGRRLPVQFVHDGNPVAEVMGLPTSEPIAQAPQLDVLALVSISNPAQGRVVAGRLTADGVASSFEGTVPWELRDAGGAVVRQGFAQGSMEDHLTPWRTDEIDVSDLPPGDYTFVAMTDDPSGGEGGGPTTDTRTVTVR